MTSPTTTTTTTGEVTAPKGTTPSTMTVMKRLLHVLLLKGTHFLRLVLVSLFKVRKMITARVTGQKVIEGTSENDTGVVKTADFSKIRYSQVWEDTDNLRKALAINAESVVFSIASAGDNVFGLLLDNPKKIVALDFNPSQLALCALKIAAIKSLTYSEFVHLLGFKFTKTPVTESPSTLYQTKVRPAMTDADHIAFWDANLALLDVGVVHTGRLEKYWGMWRKYILPITHSKNDIEKYLNAKELKDQTPFSNKGWLFEKLFKFYFGETVLALLGRDPAFFKHVDINVGESCLNRFKGAINTLPVATNFYTEYILTGDISGKYSVPAYLDPSNYETLRSRLDRIELVQGDLRAYLADPTSPKFDTYNLSDVFEWMGEDMYENTLRTIIGSSVKGARLAYWNLFVWRERPDTLKDLLEKDEKLAKELHAVDRTFFYRNFVVERVI
ncbi:hypothetical protein HDU76_008227 [Blyttiomyces sp. JEL0837]|nr:hypothetical protein HDU76_008227 [Blyttiomyces sp. JEL0837]